MWCLFALAAGGCTHTLKPDIGVFSYAFDLDADETVCINVSAYPFSIMFGSFGSDTLYREYDYWPPPNDRVTSFETLMRFLPVYRTMMDPEHSITITARSATRLTFLTAQLPGMCYDGILFSSARARQLRFGRDEPGFFNLDVYSDKCVVFGPRANITVSAKIRSSDYEDQIFVHYGFTDYVSIGANGTFNHEFTADESPFFRILADDVSPAELIEFTADVVAETRISESAIFIPNRPAQVCDRPALWYGEKVAVAMVAVTACVGFIFLGVLCAVSIRQRATPRHSRNRWRNDRSDSHSLGSISLIH